MYRSESWISTKLDLAKSQIHGMGVFARETIYQGEIVIIWGGQVFTSEQVRNGEARDHTMVGIDEDLYLGTPIGAPLTLDDYMNHSCHPNLWMSNNVTLVARSTILPGEEVTADYAFWLNDESYVMRRPCNCGADVCRQTIRGTDWRTPALQGMYAGHFSPFINRRINS